MSGIRETKHRFYYISRVQRDDLLFLSVSAHATIRIKGRRTPQCIHFCVYSVDLRLLPNEKQEKDDNSVSEKFLAKEVSEKKIAKIFNLCGRRRRGGGPPGGGAQDGG